jgi:hypothetical protein
MATSTPQFLYMLDEDLYRLGNATSPKLHNVRPGDVKNLRAQRRCDGSRRWFRNIPRHRAADRANQLAQCLALENPG